MLSLVNTGHVTDTSLTKYLVLSYNSTLAHYMYKKGGSCTRVLVLSYTCALVHLYTCTLVH